MEYLFLELSDGGGDPDVLAFLQPLLTLDQVVDTIHHQLHQLHLWKHLTRVMTTSRGRRSRGGHGPPDS